MNKTFPASEAKLALLREKGIFPRSSFFQRSVRFLVFVLLIFTFFSNKFTKDELEVFFIDPELSLSSDLFLRDLTKFIFASILFVSLSSFVGMIQSKFYFSLNLAAPDFSRFKLVNPLVVICSPSIIVHFFSYFVLFIAAGFYFYSQVKIPIVPYQSGSLYLAHINQDFIDFVSYQKKIAFTLSVMLLICGFCSLVLNWWFFRKEHMMSREEIEAEQREQQVPARFRQSVRDHATKDLGAN